MSDAVAGRRSVLIVIPVAIVFALLVLLLASSDPDDGSVNFAVRGEVAPLIEGETIDGDWFDIDDHRGRWVLVNFFSTTCVPCIREHPELVAFADRHAAAGDVVAVSVAFDDSATNVREFFAEHGGNWPVLTTDTGGIAVAYGVIAVPESYLVAPSGVVADKLIGGVTADDLDARIAAFEAAS